MYVAGAFVVSWFSFHWLWKLDGRAGPEDMIESLSATFIGFVVLGLAGFFTYTTII